MDKQSDCLYTTTNHDRNVLIFLSLISFEQNFLFLIFLITFGSMLYIFFHVILSSYLTMEPFGL
ncbi:hypothetical protein KFK09_028244 [Dendrobium nobile]|uniref:Uncharacterized protein n=1 Tax=Dendrobium nobile TaxID=94219 RepID=A0A8T3A6W4_DENNO|nr:hypothetical protein KFK09_028244 [Dendrobium nobile]